MRQHALGPYPFDPNLVAQGVPLDDRVTFGDNIFAPVEGTPLPPGVGPPPGPVPPPGAPPPAAFAWRTGCRDSRSGRWNNPAAGRRPTSDGTAW